MALKEQYGDLAVTRLDGYVVQCEIRRGPNNFFDRDLMGYRSAVREISEAMVSMLSLDEISDRLLIAVTDTMGVERGMVLLLDEEGRVLRPAAFRGEWDEDSLRFYALRLHEAGMIKSTPKTILAEGTDWRFFNELKRELKG